MDISATRDRVVDSLEPARDRALEIGHEVADRASETFDQARSASRPHLEAASERVGPATDRVSRAATTAKRKVGELTDELPGGVAGMLTSFAGALTAAAERLGADATPRSGGRRWGRDLAIFGGGLGLGAAGGYVVASRRSRVHDELWDGGEVDPDSYGQEAAQLDARRRASAMS